MNKTIEVKAQSVELAIEEGLRQLNATRDRVKVEVLNNGGLFQKASVSMTLIPTPVERAENFVNGILNKMGIKAEAIAHEKDDVIYVDIVGEGSGAVIGYRGEGLDAIQYLTLTVINEESKSFKKVIVNAENYREKREQTLISLAYRLADKAYRTGKKVALEPMNPFERRIIHSALQDSYKATTASEGEEPNRHVVIVPKPGGVRSNQQAPLSKQPNKRQGPPKFKSFGYKKGF